MRVLFFGDIVGRPGRQAVFDVLPRWRSQYQPDLVVANGENSAAGVGITPSVAEELFGAGINVLTLGNHSFNKKEALKLVEDDTRILRPANYPPGVPGYGYGFYQAGEARLAIVSLMGRVFLDAIDDPFQCINSLLPLLREQSHCILIDMHAEATSEKAALAWMLDGKVSAVVGTHTHVTTADERVLPKGSAFITDVGMVGPLNSVIGMDTETVVGKFLTHMPARFEVAAGPVVVNAVLLTLNHSTGLAEGIIRLHEIVHIGPIGR